MEMRRRQGLSKGGLIEISSPGGNVQHIQTFTCCHCNGIFLVPENPVEMGFCSKCHSRECLRCGHRLNGRCLPFEMTLLRYERRQRFLQSIAEDSAIVGQREAV